MKWSDRIVAGVQFLSAGLVIALSVIDLFGIWSHPWLKSRIPTLILLAVGVVLLSAWVERITVLRSVQTGVSLLVASQQSGARYLEEEAVLHGLRSLVDTATVKILAAGAKSTASAYLERIARKVEDSGVEYCRLLTGDHITHELHVHLAALITHRATDVAWTYSEKYGNVLVSERGVILAFPTPHPMRFRGLALDSFDHVAQFSEVLRKAFNQGIAIRTERSLEILCERCGTTTVRSKDQLERALRDAEAVPSLPSSGGSA